MTAHILGLDLALARVGAARLTRDQRLHTRHLVTTAQPDSDTATTARRIEHVVTWVLAQASPSTVLAVVERTAYNAQQAGAGDQRSAVFWMVAAALTRHGVPIATVAANTAKKYLTGHGRASKAQVRDAVAACYPHQRELRGMEFDEADASALAILGADYVGWPGPFLSGRRGSGWAKAGVWPDRRSIRA